MNNPTKQPSIFYIMLPNLLSFLRMPLALAFLQHNIAIRCAAIVLAMLTDFFDGFLARKFNCTSAAGRIIDPLADKCFVFSILTIFYSENRIEFYEVLMMLSREMAVFCFGVYLVIRNKLWTWTPRSIWSGKIATTLQLLIFLALTCNVIIPPYIYGVFIPLALTAFFQLFFDRHRLDPNYS